MRDRQVGCFRFPLKYSYLLVLLVSVCLLFFLAGCSLPQRVSATERIFRNLSLEFVDQYEIPKTTFKDTKIGGLSAIAYARQQDKFYVLSDDKGEISSPRFYTFDLEIRQTESGIKIRNFPPKGVTFLKNEENKNYRQGTIDPEGLALSPRGTVFISSEGSSAQNVKPFIAEFELETGKRISAVRLPQRYLPGEDPKQPQGIQKNLAFESLTISSVGLPKDPFRLFTAPESALLQDEPFEEPEPEQKQSRIRFLHYVINPVGNPVLIAEHLYLLEPAPTEVISNGLTELLALPTEGYFLSLERTYGFTGAGAKVFQVVTGDAIDTTRIDSLKGNIAQVRPLKKQLLFDLANLGIELDNFEGMTLGPRLPDGSESLLLMSDDNFNDEQISQLFLFRLVEN